jgi:hypothetical protein
MRFSWFIFLCLFCPFIALAQYGSITGKVVRAGSKDAVPRASVFLSNSSFGTTSTDNGNFSLNGLRQGQYTLVVTAVGFDDYTKVVLVGSEPITLTIEMSTKSIQLRDVFISTKADWRTNYEKFKNEFIGTDVNAKECEVINPEILSFNFTKRKQTLEAFADNFLIVENRALGYRVKYLIKDYKSDRISGLISYSGQQLFEELPGKPAQKKKWQAKRDEAYYGSSMHFYRSLYKDRLNEEGFEAYRLGRLPNANRPPESLIYKNIERFKASNNYAYRDSLRYWVNLESLSRYYMDQLSSVKYLSFEICKTTDQPGVFVLTFPADLYVIYTKKREETYFRDIFRPLTMPNYETSVLSFLTEQRYSFFDMNGVIMNKGPLYEGTWSKSRLSMLLPVDYVPIAEQETNKKVSLPSLK